MTVPAHNRLAPVRACVIAAARDMPGVCGVLRSSSPARTIFTPFVFQSIPHDNERRDLWRVEHAGGIYQFG